MKIVRLFMRDGRITKFCAGLSYTTRKRVFRAIRIVRKKQFKRMLKEWEHPFKLFLADYSDCSKYPLASCI